MEHVGTGILPVVKGVLDQEEVGVVTDRDLCVRVVAPGLFPAHTWVRDRMTRNPICCRPGDDVELALELMRHNQVRRLPVIDDARQLQGMPSISDLIRREATVPESVYRTLKQICRPRIDNKTDRSGGHCVRPYSGLADNLGRITAASQSLGSGPFQQWWTHFRQQVRRGVPAGLVIGRPLVSTIPTSEVKRRFLRQSGREWEHPTPKLRYFRVETSDAPRCPCPREP
jgi:hypothetical protein